MVAMNFVCNFLIHNGTEQVTSLRPGDVGGKLSGNSGKRNAHGAGKIRGLCERIEVLRGVGTGAAAGAAGSPPPGQGERERERCKDKLV